MMMTLETNPSDRIPLSAFQFSNWPQSESDYYKDHMSAYDDTEPEERRFYHEQAVEMTKFNLRAETMWRLFPAGCKRFLVETPHDVDLSKLLKFWSKHRDAKWIPDNSWHLAYGYLSNMSTTMQETNNLMLNAAFLQEAFRFPSMGSFIDEVNKKVRLCGLKNRRLKQHEIYRHVASALPHLNRAYDIRSDPDFMEDYLGEQDAKLIMEGKEDCIGYVVESRDSGGFKYGTGEFHVMLVNEESKEECMMKIGPSTHLKKLFNDYADEKQVSLRSLRFSYEGRTLFLSSAGSKTPVDLGMKIEGNSNIIVVTDVSKANGQDVTPTREAPSKRAKQKKRKGKGKQKRKAQPKSKPLVAEKTEEELKIEHSIQLSKIHEEAQPRLKTIRRRLSDLAIERDLPKDKSKRRAKSPSAPPQSILNNPCWQGLGGRAGKSNYLVQVGEVANLYKSSKRRNFQHSQQEFIKLDLHGMTKKEALNSLDKILPRWNDMAMSGSYPFVIPVEIICGKGGQVLSEVVERWIRSNDQVANAPKTK